MVLQEQICDKVPGNLKDRALFSPSVQPTTSTLLKGYGSG